MVDVLNIMTQLIISPIKRFWWAKCNVLVFLPEKVLTGKKIVWAWNKCYKILNECTDYNVFHILGNLKYCFNPG